MLNIFKCLISVKILTIVFLLIVTETYAQSQFQRAIGGPGTEENAYSIIQTADGGYALAGYTTTSTYGNIYIAKLDGNGTLQWTRAIGGSGSDVAWSIVQTTDRGYVATGYTNSFGTGLLDMYIVKLDSNGTLQWSKTVGGTGHEMSFSIIQTTDGGFAVAGYSYSFAIGDRDMYIVKLDGNGNLQWSKTIGGSLSDIGWSIIQTTDGGYAVAGSTESFGAGQSDFYIVKLDSIGTLQWNRTVGGPAGEDAVSIRLTTDGGYAVAGNTGSFGAGQSDFYIVKLSSSGMLQWTRSVGATLSENAYSLIQTTDGGYAVAGYTRSFGFDKMYLVKLDISGSTQWTKTMGGLTTNDYGSSIIKSIDGGYASAGEFSSFGAGNYDMFIVKFDANWITCGNITSRTSSSGTGGTLDSPTSVVNSPTSIVTTPTPPTSTYGTLTIVCTVTGIQPKSNEIPSTYCLFQNYPNPFNPVTKISYSLPEQGLVSLKIFDIQGQEIEILVNEEMKPGSYEIKWDGSNYSSGIYIYKLISQNFIDSKKMILMK